MHRSLGFSFRCLVEGTSSHVVNKTRNLNEKKGPRDGVDSYSKHSLRRHTN